MHRSRRIPLIIFTCILTMGASVMFAAKPSKPGGGGGGSTGTTVTSTVFDQNAASESYRIHSDFPRTGTQMYFHGVDSVVSQLPGYYELSALSSTARTLFVDFGDPVVAGTSVPPEVLGGATSGYVPGRFISKSSGIDKLTGVGSTLISGLPFVFTGADGQHYQVRMNSANEPGTDDGVFTCIHVNGSNQNDPAALCNGWSARPATESGKAVGRLTRTATVRGKTVTTYLGDYYMTWYLEFTNP